MVMLATVFAAACADPSDGRYDRSSASPSAMATAPMPPTSSPSAGSDNDTRVRIAFGDQQIDGAVFDTRAGRGLTARLPLELDLADHGRVEKTGPLPGRLSTDGEPDGADPPIGAIGCYAPNRNLVLYYGDQSYYPGIVVLGRMEDGFERLADVDGNVRVTVSALE